MPTMMTASVPSYRIPGHPDAENRIFVGGIPYYLTDEQCRELLGSFGAIKSFELIKDKETGMGKGWVDRSGSSSVPARMHLHTPSRAPSSSRTRRRARRHSRVGTCSRMLCRHPLLPGHSQGTLLQACFIACS